MILIVGLGNPGKEYENTRHNVGFRIIDNYVNNNSLKYSNKFNGDYAECLIKNEKVILLKPLSYMNESGSVVLQFVKYFKIENENILMINDDMDFEVGTYKLKRNGSSAGHNGVLDVIKKLNSENIKRFRIGISKSKSNKINYVLGKFSKNEEKIINEIVLLSEKVLEDFVILNFDDLMAKYN